ncbi:hypothetical protein KAH94_01030 [bacterium]|nr:hypothetical protein [bacterium]
MTQEKKLLHLEIDQTRPALCRATVLVDKELVNNLYHEAVLSQQKTIKTYGFRQGSVPIEYIKQNFNSSLTDHLKEFLFNYFVISFLNKEIRIQKIFAAGEPRLTDIIVDEDNNTRFHFDLTTFPTIPFQNWKYFPFKAPKRKKYKDLDRQVSSFVKDEKEKQKSIDTSSIKVGDWVCFNIILLNNKNEPVFGDHKENLWIKIGNEAGDEEFQKLFLNKKIGEQFITNDECVQDYFSSMMDTNYTFSIEVNDILHHSFFCTNQFKRHFKIKTNKEMLQRIVEVFSFRNDLSQRQLMIEESLKLLLNRHHFSVPKYLILRQEKLVLSSVRDNPDYHVYRMQKDFRDYVRQLAEKQIKETILLDQLSHKENVRIEHEDIKNYLSLTNRSRMKDFIYFEHPETKVDGREMPISSELLKQACLREKTLNYIIYHLTRK